MAGARFLTLSEVAEELAISMPQAYALVRRGDLPAVQIGGRSQWRVERAKLEEFIAGLYERARADREAEPPVPDDVETDGQS